MDLINSILEDHAGDIVHKARALRGVSVSEAATAAGVSTAQFIEFEQTGVAKWRIDFDRLGRALGISGRALRLIAEGWTPSPPDLKRWPNLLVFTSCEYGNRANCYLVWDGVSKCGLIFDTGWDSRLVIEFVKREGISIEWIFLTHSHIDHISGLETLVQEFPAAKVCKCGSVMNKDGMDAVSEIEVGSFTVKPIRIPGHTFDSTCYVVGGWVGDAPEVVFVGDTIFCGSLGKGFYSWQAEYDGVKNNILTLPERTLLCPGHGPMTTVGTELAHNPFFALA